jgi:hypothetical protein
MILIFGKEKEGFEARLIRNVTDVSIAVLSGEKRLMWKVKGRLTSFGLTVDHLKKNYKHIVLIDCSLNKRDPATLRWIMFDHEFKDL